MLWIIFTSSEILISQSTQSTGDMIEPQETTTVPQNEVNREESGNDAGAVANISYGRHRLLGRKRLQQRVLTSPNPLISLRSIAPPGHDDQQLVRLRGTPAAWVVELRG